VEQLTQNLKDGHMQLLEVPFPALHDGAVLVRNHYSVISTGTEGKTVKDARKGYIGKARSRKDEVKKVITAARTHGLMKTYKMVMNKLESPAALGYSCAGEVIAVAPDVNGLKVGDFVACAGAGAVHAEVVAVPINLCAKVHPSISLKHAAFTTIAAIAMQGIRQADVRLGEHAVVIGLGVVGQITLKLLKAAGVRTIGVDIDEKQVSIARENGADLALNRNTPELEEIIAEATGGHGTDAVIITAGTSSLDPVELAGTVARRKGKVIIVGAVPTGFSRKNYYKKELDLRMSSSYGPGRHDSDYEEKGIDYPIGYVRWTENRNMQAFLHLLKDESINIDGLVTHEFEFESAKEAYQMIVDRTEHFAGVALKYDTSKTLKKSIELSSAAHTAAAVKIGFVGAGSFAQNFLLPAVKGKGALINVATSRGNTARNIADKHGFSKCTGDANEVLQSDDLNTIFIATRHHTHAQYVLDGLRNGKNVFVEKPLCMTEDELEEIKVAYGEGKNRLMVGFNRRFAPHIQQIKNAFSDDLPKAINYRVNAGAVPTDHWIHDPKVGGGRIIGEACHFIDLAMYVAGSPITAVSAQSLDRANGLNDTIVVQLRMANGSIASINYFSNGSKDLPKEYLEVFCGGQTAIVEDFLQMRLLGSNSSKSKLSTQDKGHFAEVDAFLSAVRDGKPEPIPFADSYLSTLATFKAIESLQHNGALIEI
jgi:predicted dehydrogenase/threonine dehydrogenase-like Zn-dependent dehydrogenase